MALGDLGLSLTDNWSVAWKPTFSVHLYFFFISNELIKLRGILQGYPNPYTSATCVLLLIVGAE